MLVDYRASRITDRNASRRLSALRLFIVA